MNSNASTDQNVASLMADVARSLPSKPALVFERNGSHETISFSQLWQDANSVVGGLKKLGLTEGDRVIVMIPMSIDLYVCLLAIIQMGAIAVFVDPWIGAKQIARFSAFAEPTAFIGINKSHLLRWSNGRLRNIAISVTNEFRIGPFLASHSLSKLKSSQPDTQVAAVTPDQTALITFTSGSSGNPKGANRTHRFLKSQHLALKKEFPYQPDDIDMPMFPVFALNNLVTGITSVVPEMDFRKVAEVSGDRILAQMKDWKITTCTASPPLLDRLADAIESRGSGGFHLRRALTGGAPVSDQQLQRWTSIFASNAQPEPAEIIVAYGSTEAEPVGHINGLDRINNDGKSRGYCTGKPSSLVQTKIIPITKGVFDLEQRPLEEVELPQGEIGELIVAGDHVCRDYYKNEEATRENKLIDKDGTVWHRMGDTGYFDDEGKFWLVGRVHSTIFRDSGIVHPQIIEQIAKTASAEVLQVAAIGLNDPILEVAVGLVVFTESENQNEIELEIRVALKNENQPCERVLFTDQPLPVDPRHNSKIDYEKVLEHFN